MLGTATCFEPFSATLKRFNESFDSRFSSFLEVANDVPDVLAEAMRYSALAPGKRLRPFLVSECCRLAGGTAEAALPAAMAVECVHAFSLIHDDLPAMDDQGLRRGRPTCHVKFGQAMAILAGDALLTLAFEALATRVVKPECALALVAELAVATGRQGMIAGQVADMEGESHPPHRRRVEYIHERKTARLMQAACRMGVLAAEGEPGPLHDLGLYGLHLGRAFQIADDLLDVTARAGQTGKGVGQDRAAGKQTYPASVGVAESRLVARQAADDAVAAVRVFGDEARSLRALIEFVLARDS